MVDFLTQYDAGHGCQARQIAPQSTIYYYPTDFVYLLDRAPESKFEGLWTDCPGGGGKRVIGRTRFNKLGLTINNTIGRFLEGGLAND